MRIVLCFCEHLGVLSYGMVFFQSQTTSLVSNKKRKYTFKPTKQTRDVDPMLVRDGPASRTVGQR